MLNQVQHDELLYVPCHTWESSYPNTMIIDFC